MIERDQTTGVLMEHTSFDVVDVPEPNLLREVFPYSQVPRITFDYKSVPLRPAENMYITDTTFRDGQQARPPYTVQQIVELYDMLHRLGGPNGVIRASEFFLYSDKDKEAVRKCLERGYKYPEVTGWIRANRSDFQLVKDMGMQETGILTSASDYHIFHKFKKTRAQVLEEYMALIATALESGLTTVRCHLEDVTRADIYGFIIPFCQQLMELAEQSKKVIKVRLCDTMGYGLPYPETTLPRSVPKLVHAMIHEAGVPSEWLEWHGHNDFHKVLANAQTAWLYGCAAANGTLLGFGERTGNPPIEGLVIEYIALKGSPDGMDTTVISEIGEYFKRVVKAEVPAGYPFVGDNFNSTSAGIHADGVMKDEEIYNIFDTEKLLNRPVGVNVTDKSGIAGIAHWVNRQLGLKEAETLDKRHPGLQEIYEWVEQQYKEGRVTAISDDEMLHLSRVHLPEYFKSEFDELKEKAQDISTQIVRALLADTGIQSLDPAKAHPVLEKAVREHRFMQFAYITDSTGRKVTKNITHPEDQAKYDTALTDEDFSDRDWFKAAMDSKTITVTDFYKSRITGALCITVSAPVVVDGDIKGVLGVDLKFEDLVRL